MHERHLSCGTLCTLVVLKPVALLSKLLKNQSGETLHGLQWASLFS